MSSLSERAAIMQQTLQKISQCSSMEEKIEYLQKAFELFNRETSRLEELYAELKNQLHQVNSELAEANQQLNQKVIELHRLTQSLEGILTHISQAIIFINLDGLVTTFNPAAEEILHKKKDAVLFQGFFNHFSDDVFGYSMREALEICQVPSLTFVSYFNGQDSKKELEIVSTCVIDKEQTAESSRYDQGIIIVIRDLTKLFQLQLQASRNDRMKDLGEMAAQMAHEIRNPLGGIKGFAALLERDLSDQPDLKKMASYIVEGTDNLNRLVTQVLNYSRQLKLRLIETNLGILLEEVQQHMLADAAFSDKIRITIQKPPQPVIGEVDVALFKGVLLNLAINAIQAMPEGGDLTMSVDSSGTEAVIKIMDTGIGIPAENIEKIFSPFFTTKIGGNGFGLAEVHKVILAHAGTIDVESKVGQGSTFIIRTPLGSPHKDAYGN